MELAHQRAFTVQISDCDVVGRIRPSTLIRNLHEIGEEQAVIFGLSRAELLKNQMCWVLYRQRAVLRAPIVYGDEVVATTWPGVIEGPILPRYFTLEKPDGTRIGEAVTAWVLMQTETRRPLRPTVIPGGVPQNRAKPAPLPTPSMLHFDDPQPIGRRAVSFCDVDVNGHLNNARALEWALDALPFDRLRDQGLAECQVNYISEGKPGEVLMLHAQEEDGATLIAARRVADNRTVFEARIVYGAMKG